jgi:hypothetical protein
MPPQKKRPKGWKYVEFIGKISKDHKKYFGHSLIKEFS